MIVVLYAQIYGVGGIARYLQSLLKEVPNSERVLVVCSDEQMRDLNLGSHIEFLHLPMPRGRLGLVLWSLKTRFFLRDLAKKEAISLINLHIPPLIPGLFLPRVAQIWVTAHTTYLGMSGQFYVPKQFDSQWSAWSVEVKKIFERIIFAKADRIITLTEQGRQEVLKYKFRKPIYILPNGVLVDQFSPADSEKDIDVIFVGRIEKRKGSRPMVDVCKALIEKDPDIKICIVGYGDDFDYVKAHLTPFSKNIELAGKQPFEKVLSFYHRSKIYASTSYYEGLPGTCLEAMAVELVPVVWDYLFYNGLVINNETGRVIKPNDIEAFVSAIIDQKSDSDGCRKIGASARRMVVNHYDWKKITLNLMDVLKE
ncbi:glycosyltransferase family 4 protein [Asticcacaulis sp.]|uniref:glycosyltransferase family 4 protein n=1 Tax=Asticcacaulis sp. TaxID=1872648 RepID=UPI0031DB4C4E